MMRRSLLFLVALAACAGKAPPDPGVVTDAPLDDGDASIGTVQYVSGQVIDFFGQTALADTSLASDGIDPPSMTTTGPDGSYVLGVPVGSKFFVTATRTSYRPTRNAPLSVTDQPLTQNIYAMSVQDVKNQYTLLGKSPAPGTAFFVADLVKTDGTPLEGVPLASITLVDGANPVPGVIGPYFFGAAGSIDPALATSKAYGGHARVAFLDVPSGTYTLRVTYNDAANQPVTSDTLFQALADGATLTAMGANAMLPPPPDPGFATDIYPRLQKAANGGLGCANCHTANGPAAVLQYDLPGDMVLANMKAIPGVIDLTTPANSLVLVRPLYEKPPTPQDHPNATFLDTNDPDYKLFLAWITKGAKP